MLFSATKGITTITGQDQESERVGRGKIYKEKRYEIRKRWMFSKIDELGIGRELAPTQRDMLNIYPSDQANIYE